MVGVQERAAGRLRVRDVMTSPAVTVKGDTPVKEVAEVLLRHRISGVPVVSESGELVGILTEADLLYKELPEEKGGWWFRPDPQGLRKREGVVARDLMSWPVITVEEDTPLREAARLMARHRVNRLPVVRGGQVVGSTTADGTDVAQRPVLVEDVFQTFCRALGINANTELYTPSGRPL
ncbi:MAG: CBS domain-containing protein, partial [Firmicutes bacterium]|nr:CBS domain-containing protein [Bacillota bacterium]